VQTSDVSTHAVDDMYKSENGMTHKSRSVTIGTALHDEIIMDFQAQIAQSKHSARRAFIFFAVLA
jgi:hypothetical protein